MQLIRTAALIMLPLCGYCCIDAGEAQRAGLMEFLGRWPSVESALGATWQQIHTRLESYGVTPDMAKTLLRFCG